MNQPVPNQPASNDNTIAALTHIGGLFFGFIPALVVWLIKKDEGGFVVDQAIEALNFQITVLLAVICALFLAIIVIGAFLLPVIFILDLIFCIIAAVKASNGEQYRYPITLRLIK